MTRTIIRFVTSLLAFVVNCQAKTTAKSWKIDGRNGNLTSIGQLLGTAHFSGTEEAFVFGVAETEWSQRFYVTHLSKDNELAKLALLRNAEITDATPHPTDSASMVVLDAGYGFRNASVGVLKTNSGKDYRWTSVKEMAFSNLRMQKIVAFNDDYCVVGGILHPSDYVFVAFDLNKNAALNVLWTKRQRLDWSRENATLDLALFRLDSMARIGDDNLIVASTAVSNTTVASVLCKYQVSREGMTQNWCQRHTFDSVQYDVVQHIHGVGLDSRNPGLVLVGKRAPKDSQGNVTCYLYPSVQHINLTDGMLNAAYYWDACVGPTVSSVIHYGKGADNPIVEIGIVAFDESKRFAKAGVLQYSATAKQLHKVLVWEKPNKFTPVWIQAMSVSETNARVYVASDRNSTGLVTITSTDCFVEMDGVQQYVADDVVITEMGTVLFGDYGVDMWSPSKTPPFSFLNEPFAEKKLCPVGGGHNGHSLNGGAIAGIVVGIVAAMFLIAVAVRYAHDRMVTKQGDPYTGLVDEHL